MMIVSENYLDPDVAYTLGLISARGSFQETTGDRKIVIEFPFKSLVSEGIKLRFDQETQLKLAVNQIRDRIYELVEADIDVKRSPSSITMTTRFLRHSMVWRVIKYHFKDADHYQEFEMPDAIYAAPPELQREYVRGFADAAGYIRQSNNYYGKKRRVYLEVANRNWKIPIQLCRLLQRHLDVPVQIIQWGHPNTREPNRLVKGTTWAREHQVKIFSEAFLPVGFYVDYKQRILEEFAKDDVKRYPGPLVKCNPNPALRRINKKPKHPEEKNKHIPAEIRGQHFDAYWQICVALGCDQREEGCEQIGLFADEEEDTE